MTTGKGMKDGWKHYAIDSGRGAAFAGSKCLKKATAKKDCGCKAFFDLPKGEDEIYHRLYMKVSKNLGSDKYHRLMCFHGVRDGQGTYQVYGANTPASDGRGPFWIDLNLHNFQKGDEIRKRVFNVDIKKTDYSYILHGTKNKVPVDKWFCLEMMVKLNTPGVKDGVMRLWIDGREVFRHNGVFVRTVPEVKIRTIVDQLYADKTRMTGNSTFWVDNRVIARRYVGPMKKE